MSGIPTLDHELERAELKRVLSSRLFSRAPSLSKMLAYICELQLTGQAQRIKEYNIAVEALGRGADFDPAADSIIRVEAARLRRHLEQYYAAEGADHALQLRVAEVGYTPRFVPAAAPATENGAAPGVPPAETGSTGKPASRLQLPALDGAAKVSPRVKMLATLLTLAVAAVGLLATGYLRSRSVNPAATAPSRLPQAAGTTGEIRIHAGSAAPRFIDSSGALWVNDQYFNGGAAFSRPDRQILRTLDQSLYQTGREGNFKYSIPLSKGVYELHLHFAETSYGQNPTDGAEKLRLFDVSVNGQALLSSFDISADVGGANTADEKIFKDISPADDGYLHLDFSTRRNEASLNGIEILPGQPGKALPTRVVCSPHSYYDQRGQLWKADRYFLGGRLVAAPVPVSAAADPGIYASNRWGHFTYAVPVAEGTYRLKLRFAEPVWASPASPGNSGRLFDVYCNGRSLENRLDIFKEAGSGNRALDLTFHGLRPNAQNKLMLSFVPIRDYAILFAFEVEDETPAKGIE